MQIPCLNMVSTIFLCFLVSSLLTPYAGVEAVIVLPKNVTVPALIVFGDSIVDPGNNNYKLGTLAKCNLAPYGRDFIAGKPTGRCCDGKLPTDFIVEELGIKELLPAYLDPSLTPNDLLTGVSFASVGSGYDPLSAQLLGVIPLSDQMIMFTEYIGKLKANVGEARTTSILSNSIHIVVSVSNDLSNYFTLRRHDYDIPAYTDFLVQHASTFIQGLYDKGARRFGVFGAPPIGCLPFQRTIAGGIQRECQDVENQAAITYNSKLSAELGKLKSKHQDGKFVYIDIYSTLWDIIQNPTSYGFQVADKGCCGSGNLEAAILCNVLSPFTCENVPSYVFWDSYHPTEKTYKILTDIILKKHVTDFF